MVDAVTSAGTSSCERQTTREGRARSSEACEWQRFTRRGVMDCFNNSGRVSLAVAKC